MTRKQKRNSLKSTTKKRSNAAIVSSFSDISTFEEDEDLSEKLEEFLNNGYDSKVLKLVEELDDINKKFSSEKTILMMSCEYGRVELVKHFIKSGANIDDVTEFGYTALSFACENGYLEIVQILYEAGANILFGNVEGEFSSPLETASFSGHLDIVKFLVDAGINVNKFGGESLCSACSMGHFDVCQYLVKIGVNVNFQSYFTKSFPLC